MSKSDPYAGKLHGDTVRPLKWGRVTLHVGGGLLVLVLYLAYFTHAQILLLSGLMLTALSSIDLLRWRFEGFNHFIFEQFGNFTQPHERLHMTSATWFWVAMFLVALLDHPISYIASLAILTLADQAGSIVGRRFGTIPLGSAGGAALALICSSEAISTSDAILVSLGGGFTGALAELGSERIDDNLSVGIVTGSTVFALSTLLGLG